MKPNWEKGDVIAMPSSLSKNGVYDGCWIGIAEHEPRLDQWGTWWYGGRDCRELRRATVADVDRLIAISQGRLRLEELRLEELRNLRGLICGKN